MGEIDTMMRSLTLALVALAVANVMALPLAGDEAPNAMFDDNDDDATVMAEMSKAIGRVQMGMSPNDLGESATVDEAGETDWAKRAKNEIDSMSQSEMAMVPKIGDDRLVDQFKADVANAKNAIKSPMKRAADKTEVEKEADAALADPKAAAELKAEGEKAELAMQESLPGAMSLLQEAPEDNADEDLGESDEEFSLMSGSDDDVAKQINDQISSQVANQLGSIDTETGSEDVLEKFEKDKAQAAEFVEAKAAEDAKKKKAKAAAMKALAEAREAMERATMSAEESSEEDLGESAGTN